MSTAVWFLSRSNMLRARSTTQSFHSGRLPGTFQVGSMPAIVCQVPWLSRLVSSIMYTPFSSHRAYHRLWSG